MEPAGADPVIAILAAAVVGLLAGVGAVLSLPKAQPALRIGIVGTALILLIADGMGHHIVPFGFGVDPDTLDEPVSVASLLAPRIAYLSFLMGVISSGISRRAQTMAGLVIATALLFGPMYLSGSTQATLWGVYQTN
ncbi:MAG: hypothetical protein AAGB16_09165 [Pseudomonadota bacterium]